MTEKPENQEDAAPESEPSLEGDASSEATTVLLNDLYEAAPGVAGPVAKTGTVLLSDEVEIADPLPFEPTRQPALAVAPAGPQTAAQRATPFEPPGTVLLGDNPAPAPAVPFGGDATPPKVSTEQPQPHPETGGTVTLHDALCNEEKGALPFREQRAQPVVPPNPLKPRATPGVVMLSEMLTEPETPTRKDEDQGLWIDNPTALSAEIVPWPERSCLTLVLTARCVIVPGEAATWCAAPSPAAHADGLDAAADGPLTEPSFAVPFKARADVMVVGFAHAPGPDTRSMTVTLKLGKGAQGVKSEIAVFGERVWEPAVAGMQPSKPEAFDRVPLRHEFAFGGKGNMRNPVGRGLRRTDGQIKKGELPQLERPDRRLRAPIQTPAPACWAPIPDAWRDRWIQMEDDSPFPSFSEAQEWARYQSAMPEMQCPFLRGDEPFELAGMHPDHANLQGKLPANRVRIFVARSHLSGGKFEEVSAQLDTVLFKPSRLELWLTYRAQMTVTDWNDPQVASIHVRATSSSERPRPIEEWQAEIIKG